MGARMLHTTGQGELSLYANFIMLGSLVLSLGLPSAIVHFIASKKIEKEFLIPILLRTLLLGLAILSIILLFLYSTNLIQTILPLPIYSDFTWILILVFHLVIVILNVFLSSILQAETKFKEASFIGIIGSLILISFYAIQYFKNDAILNGVFKWIVFSMLISQLIQLVLYIKELFLYNDNYFKFSWQASHKTRPLLQFAFLAFITNLIQFFSYRMDIWFIHYFHNTSQTGIYALAASLAQMVWLLPAAIQSVLYAFISTHQDKQLNLEKTISTTKQIGIYALSAGIIGYLLSVWLVPILFGQEFYDSIQCIGILLIGIVPFCLSMSISAYFAATGRVRINLYSAIIGFAICLMADIILIPRYGIIGAAYASVISYISTVLYLILKFRVELKSN